VDLLQIERWSIRSCLPGMVRGLSPYRFFGPSYVSRGMWQVLVQGLQATGMKLPEVAECCRVVAAVALLSDPELGRGPRGPRADGLHS
jgi:hypothetical protein